MGKGGASAAVATRPLAAAPVSHLASEEFQVAARPSPRVQPAVKKEIKTLMVKMDERHAYIRWLLKRETEPRAPLASSRIRDDKIRAAALAAFAAEDAEHDKVLEQYKRCGYAHVPIDILDDDDEDVPDDQCVDAEPVDDDEVEEA